MSATIFSAGAQPWLIDRSVESFRGGLIKVTRTYKVKTEDAESILEAYTVGTLLDNVRGEPIYIYPEPQFKSDGDGFSTVVMTGYGAEDMSRYSARDFISEPGIEGINVSVIYQTNGVATGETDTESITGNYFTCRYVLTEGESPPNVMDASSDFKMWYSNGRRIYSGEYESTASIRSSSSTYYGKVTEVTSIVGFTVIRTINTNT